MYKPLEELKQLAKKAEKSTPRLCHLCGEPEKDKYCTNESCYEFIRHEKEA